MLPDVVARAFEPFFTTQEIGKGSGLGLSQVYGFVRQSGGFVMLNSEVDQGTEITMYLPPSANSIAARQVHADSMDLKHGRGESVLIVEDDPAVLALAIELLNGLGYRVMTASDGAGALEILKRGDHIDLIFTDVVMPGGRTGVQLATEARLLRPNVKVLLTSGYTGEALARHKPKALPLIEKPFREAELATKLREVLEPD
jgi:CheY-like chemotaxis protein